MSWWFQFFPGGKRLMSSWALPLQVSFILPSITGQLKLETSAGMSPWDQTGPSKPIYYLLGLHLSELGKNWCCRYPSWNFSRQRKCGSVLAAQHLSSTLNSHCILRREVLIKLVLIWPLWENNSMLRYKWWMECIAWLILCLSDYIDHSNRSNRRISPPFTRTFHSMMIYRGFFKRSFRELV